MNKLFKKSAINMAVMLGVFTVPLTTSFAITLPTTPLVSGATVEPNLMLLLDNSGSMKAIVEQESTGGYDADNIYIACDTGNTIANGSTVDFLYLNNPNIAYFNVTGINGSMFLGNGGTYSYNGKNYNKKCFEATGSYTASLNTTQGSTGTYSGNFLNWYFQLFTGESYNNGKKSNSSTRLEATQSVASDLVSDLSGIRVGLSQFTTSEGANVLVDVDDIDTNRTSLTTQISNMTASTWTPIAESLQDIGYYFSAGAGNTNLIIHEGESNQYSTLNGTIFDWSENHNSASSVTSSKTVTQYWCQQSFIVLMTDGEPTQDDNISEAIQEYSSTTATLNDGTVTNDGIEDGVNVVKAMYETDLRPDLTKSDGTVVKNNVSTYMIGFSSTSATGSSLLNDMAVAGGGSEFLTANNSDELLDAFWEAARSIFAESAAMSAVSLNSTSMSSGTSVFQGGFVTSSWSGKFSAYAYDSTTDSISSTASWNAQDELDTFHTDWSLGTPSTTRNIFTYNGTAGVVFSAANYTNLSANQKSDLLAGPDLDGISGVDEAKKLIDYIHGDKSNEGTAVTNYRTRSNLLGDIVNSTSVYVAAPELNWPDTDVDTTVLFGVSGKRYSAFKSANASRTPMTYVGANDGMLHGFDVSTGEEKFAYIPEMIASNDDSTGMHYLADVNYAHKFYVDLTPTVSDVYINSAWRSVLIGGLRAGGKGLFALDITNPSNFSNTAANAANLALWEFSNEDDADFGYSYSEPTVAMMANGKWAVITSNGYNSDTGNASLFIIYLDGPGTDGIWDSGTEYIKITTNTAITENGLSTPTVINGDDDVVDYVYAGDLQGNMWKFNLTNTSANSWEVAYEDGNGNNATPEPLFTATDSSGNAQPIISAPKILSYNSKRFVFFGTGKYLETSDLSDSSIMSYYSILDDGTTIEASTSTAPDRDALLSRTLLTSGGLRTITGGDFDLSSSKGWYMDLLNQATTTTTATAEGERVISASTVSGDVLFFNTVIPDSTVCSYGGTSWYMYVDLITGLAPDYGVFDADGDGDIDGDDAGYVGEEYSGGLLSGSVIVSGTTDGTTGGTTGASSSQITGDSGNNRDDRDIHTEDSSLAGRLSWTELLNN